MALQVDSRLGHYEVTALIVEGGMGQVYRATDTKLNRQVALKILPEAFAEDPDRLVRFQREARGGHYLRHGRHLCTVVLLFVVFTGTVGTTAFAQSDDVPRTPWGHSDLHGVLDFRTTTPLERPEGQEREVVTGDVAATYTQEQHDAALYRWSAGGAAEIGSTTWRLAWPTGVRPSSWIPRADAFRP